MPKGANTLDVFSDRQSANFNRQSAKTVGLANTLIGPGGSHVDKEVWKKSIAPPQRAYTVPAQCSLKYGVGVVSAHTLSSTSFGNVLLIK